MRTYARIDGGKVVEIIEPMTDGEGNEVAVEKRFHAALVATLVEITGNNLVAVGWAFDGASLSPPLQAPSQPAVPQVVTMRQARLALLGVGLLDDVDVAIAALPSPDREAAKIEWEYSQEVRRDKPFVQMLAPALGLDDAALDQLFMAASQL